MILTGKAIEAAVAAGDIVIDPFDPANLGPNSYDLRLAPDLLTFPIVLQPDRVIDVRRESVTTGHRIGPDGYVLLPGRVYLGATVEAFGSAIYVPEINGRSGVARHGIQVHLTAGRGLLGYVGRWTLEITVTQPTRVYADMRIAQASFIQSVGDRSIQYGGKYGRTAPQASQMWRDFARPDHNEGNRP